MTVQKQNFEVVVRGALENWKQFEKSSGRKCFQMRPTAPAAKTLH